jgi:DHA2 family multidrug resistance protein
VLATCGLLLAVLMQVIDSTIANVALPHIQGSLSASQDQITWVLTSYIVAMAIMTPLTGWAALKLGRKPVFLTAIVSFVLASVLCGLATSLPEMVCFRLLQGVSAAGMMPLSQAALVDLWSAEAMPTMMATWSATIMIGPILGPTLGGFLTEHFSWRWVFYVNVPVGVLAFLMVSAAVPANRGGHERPFDFLGYLALALFTSCVQLMVDRGPMLDWFDSREIVLYAILALCGVYVFVIQMLTARQPFFHQDVLGDRNLMTCAGLAFFLQVVLYSTNAMMPSFLQNLMGYSAEQSGLTTMWRGIGAASALLLVPWTVRRLQLRPTILLGLAISFAGLWRMAHFDLSMTADTVRVAAALQGFGLGLMSNPISVLSYATIAQRHRTEAAVLSNVFRTMGGSLGIGAMQAMLVRESATAHARLAAGIVTSDPMIRWSEPQVVDGSLSGLAALNAEITRQGSMMGYDTVFAWIGLISLLLAPLLLLLRPRPRARPELLDDLGPKASPRGEMEVGAT